MESSTQQEFLFAMSWCLNVIDFNKFRKMRSDRTIRLRNDKNYLKQPFDIEESKPSISKKGKDSILNSTISQSHAVSSLINRKSLKKEEPKRK